MNSNRRPALQCRVVADPSDNSGLRRVTRQGEEQRWTAAGALAVDMESAPLLALAQLRGLEGASLLLVSDLLPGGRTRIEPDALRAGEHRLGEVAIAALAG